MEEIGHAFAALQRIVVGGQERGELRQDVDPRLAACVLYGALEELLTGWVFERLPRARTTSPTLSGRSFRCCRTALPREIDLSINTD